MTTLSRPIIKPAKVDFVSALFAFESPSETLLVPVASV
jgi:hypothetical protein